MTECQGLFGRLFGHKYVPVFNSTPPQRINDISGSKGAVLDLIAAMTTREYVHAICTRCGHVIQDKP